MRAFPVHARADVAAAEARVPSANRGRHRRVVGKPGRVEAAQRRVAREAQRQRPHEAREIEPRRDLEPLRLGVERMHERAVRDAAPRPVVLKVIIESAALTDEAIVAVCRAAESAGADFVKTSTGFHPAGGASVHAVSLMKQTVGDRLEVKASGGIRTAADAEAMIEAGATRLGLSSSRAILEGAKAAEGY